ncbi:MAG: thioredoxin family protein [Chitinophagaceae bacterium]|nr:thioredoxin family protein [Chitinophagaceae bacterium]
MKKQFCIVAVTLSLVSCQQKNSGHFVINGKIQHGSAGKILLEELPYDGKPPVVVDSATMNEKGEFELKTEAKQENLYVLVVENGPQLYAVNDNAKVTVNYDLANYRHPSFQNSPASSDLYQFVNDYISKDSVVRASYIKIDSLSKINPADSSISLLKQSGTQQVNTLNEYIKQFITTSNSPAGVYFAINMAINSMSKTGIKELADIAAKRFKDHKGIISLQQQINLMAAQAASQERVQYALLNQPAPDLQMKDVNGQPVTISQFKGKYLLVDFWASWCGPCRQENPNVVDAFNKYKDKNFTILGVSLDNDKASWIEAIKKDGLNWNHMSDLKQWESAAVSAYKLEGIPFNVLLDTSGKIIANNLRGPALEKKLAEVLR